MRFSKRPNEQVVMLAGRQRNDAVRAEENHDALRLTRIIGSDTWLWLNVITKRYYNSLDISLRRSDLKRNVTMAAQMFAWITEAMWKR